MRNLTLVLCCLLALNVHAQFNPHAETADTSWKTEYRAFATKVNDLVHTRLDAKLDYTNSRLIGKAWLTLKPHFYPTDSLTLDAKGMIIKSVAMVKGGKNIPLPYQYTDSMQLQIALDRTYKNNEKYTVFLDYIARPDEYQGNGGSAAIKNDKGLYFINPLGEEKDKPTQVWTQGETEANSVWIPTIDKPNQKSTQEFNLTVPAKYVTLSNGKLTSRKNNSDGTRTDSWKMELPNAPYLFFIGVGDYAIVKDSYKGKEVSYYVEKPYEKVARKIFGLTPEMIGFYSKLLGYEYPWVKYSQMTARDYVSGAMENTTATLHQESAQQNARELVDGNRWEDVIAHELFHHWFGDLVTAESWSNLPVNESFANYSEYLWREHKYGKDAADEQGLNEVAGYLRGDNPSRDLIRYYYRDKEDMFDAVSYNKGGRILHMLRNYAGDSAFFRSLNLYLTRNKFGNGNADKLRLAFEEVTGKDWNWFFNQWFFGSGHPELEIRYHYDEDTHQVSVYIDQVQKTGKLFRLPMAVEIYDGPNKVRFEEEISHLHDTLFYTVNKKPDLVNIDADKVLLAVKKDNKTLEEYIHQYRYAKTFLDRNEAVDFARGAMPQPAATQLIKDALSDPYFLIRRKAVTALFDSVMDANTRQKIETMAVSDPNRIVRADAIDLLGSLKDKRYRDLFLRSVKDSSYTVAGSALLALFEIDEDAALALLPELQKDAKGALENALNVAEIYTKTDADFDEMYEDFENAAVFDQLSKVNAFLIYLARVENTDNFKKGVDMLVKFRERLAPFVPGFREAMNREFTTLKNRKLSKRNKSANAAAIDEQVAYLEKQIR
ncbi:MAG TPA: M1 family aminopeptidase [Chitinophagaceae bacterium]